MAARKIFTAAERFRVLERDGFCCVYCGKSAVDGVCLSVAFHLDHVYPRSCGGSDLMSNLATACSDCNAGKGDSVLSKLPPGLDDSVKDGFARHCQRNEVLQEVAQDPQRISPWDRCVIELLLCSHDICVEVVGAVVVEDIQNDACRAIFSAASAIVAERGVVTFSSLCNRMQEPVLCDLLLSIQSDLDGWFSGAGMAKDGTYSSERLRAVQVQDYVEHFRLAIKARAEERYIQEALAGVSNMPAEEQAALLEKLASRRREDKGMDDPKDW